MSWTTISWLALLLIFLFAETQTVTLITGWFAIGSLVALIASSLGAAIWLQATLFFVISVILLLALRPLCRKYLNPRIVKTNVDAIIGTQGYVTADIDNMAAIGQVKLGGMEWTARSTSGEPIAKGVLVSVDKIEGVKAFVSPAQVPAKK